MPFTYLSIQRRVGDRGKAANAGGGAGKGAAPGNIAQNLSGGKHAGPIEGERGEFLYTSHERGLSLEEKSQLRKLVGEGCYKRNQGEEKTMAERRWFTGWLDGYRAVAWWPRRIH